MEGTSVSVERQIPAPASAIFALLADPGRHHEFDGSGTVVGTPTGTDGPVRAVGDTFGMKMRQGVPYRMVNTVVEFEADRRIAWAPHATIPLLGRAIGGRIWRYELEPTEGGTLVRETWDISGEVLKPLVRAGGLPRKTRANMERSLERLSRAVS